DVLLCYGRWALPLRIPVDHFASWEEGDRKFLASFYKPCPAGKALDSSASGNAYYLRTIPLFVRKADAGPVTDQVCLRILGAHYRELEDGYLLSSQYVNEMDEAALN